VEYVPVFGAHAARTGVRIMPTPNFFSHGPFLSTLAAISRTPFAEKCPRTPRRICATREIVLGPRDDAATAGKNPRGRPKILSVRAIRDRRERMARPAANRRRGTCDGGPQRPKNYSDRGIRPRNAQKRSQAGEYDDEPIGVESGPVPIGSRVRAALFFVLATSTVTSAQTFHASVRGRVRDAGGVVRSASVHLIDDNTHLTMQASTNDAGQYALEDVLPGAYTIRVEAPGYKTFTQSHIVVSTQAALTIDV